MAEGHAHAGVAAAAQQGIKAAQDEGLRSPQENPALSDLGDPQPDLLRGDRSRWAEQRGQLSPEQIHHSVGV